MVGLGRIAGSGLAVAGGAVAAMLVKGSRGGAGSQVAVGPRDLVAGALASRHVSEAIRLLEIARNRGSTGVNDILLLTYLYCLNGNVGKAESLVADNAGSIKRDWFIDWLWAKLETDFGFHPPH